MIRGGDSSGRCPSPSSRRAWVEMLYLWDDAAAAASPSSRRAWVEISRGKAGCPGPPVALLAEGVGRNCNLTCASMRWVSRPPRGGRG